MRFSLKSAVIAAGIAAFGLSASAANAQSFTALYDYTGATGSQVSQAVSSVTGTSTGLTFGDVVRGAGITATGAANSINSNGWSTTAGIDLTDYYGVSVTAATGSTVSLSSLGLTYQRSGTGPTSFALRSSVDGFASDLFTFTETVAGSPLSRTIDLSTVSALQNLTGVTTLRLYGYGNTSGAAGGTFRLSSPTAGTGTTITGTLNRTVTVPEAGTLALIAPALGVIGAVVVRRRKTA